MFKDPSQHEVTNDKRRDFNFQIALTNRQRQQLLRSQNVAVIFCWKIDDIVWRKSTVDKQKSTQLKS